LALLSRLPTSRNIPTGRNSYQSGHRYLTPQAKYLLELSSNEDSVIFAIIIRGNFSELITTYGKFHVRNIRDMAHFGNCWFMDAPL
jgi:hypothetical protein